MLVTLSLVAGVSKRYVRTSVSLKAQPLRCPERQIVFSVSADQETEYNRRRIGTAKMIPIGLVISIYSILCPEVEMFFGAAFRSDGQNVRQWEQRTSTPHKSYYG